ncbi:hypothetical protein VSH64_26280 [Amycolatopsis rhabdoformis]|uniref:Uncharacterized protein n=1 Tax=Amycolatopsis rhabdoformis TaxID=1448059 RepID=A0ABZ1HXT4_9PSEU|nr:hypothetical protein [Amycolatopsis rhabdoformis]WSE26388.1 hypothetical protein VSH64_26280 [Amycolatopsis rhabdoformis]
MGLEYEADTRVAQWLVETGAGGRLVLFGPKGFEAYARVRFIRDPQRPGEREADVTLARSHKSDLWQTQRVIARLTEFTTTDHGYFAVWDGYSDLPLPTYDGLFELPHRRYAIFKGPLNAIDDWVTDMGAQHPPAFVWPTDRAWCFAADVDPHWAGVGAARDAIRALTADEELDAIEADPEQQQPHYG